MLPIIIPFAVLLAVLASIRFPPSGGPPKLPSGGGSGGGGSGSGGGSAGLPPPDVGKGFAYVRQLAIICGAPKEWQDFLVLVASGESRGLPNVGLGVKENAPPWVEMHTGPTGDAEAKAAARAYERNRDMFAKCWPRAAYFFGSGGFFGLLPANALVAFQGSELACLHPWTIFDPKISVIMASWFARRLSQWPTWEGTVLSLRTGWGDPSAMGTAREEERRSKFEEDCDRAKLPRSFLDQELKRWKPSSALELFDRIGGDRGWLPKGAG